MMSASSYHVWVGKTEAVADHAPTEARPSNPYRKDPFFLSKTDASCRDVARYLERFGVSAGEFDVDRVSSHLKKCSSCYSDMLDFFRLMEVPETEYLDETLNDLTSAIYNFVKSLMAQSSENAANSDRHDNVRFVQQPGEASDYLLEGQEMIDDVQDFAGSDQVRGASMEGIRDLIERSQEEFEFAISLLEKAANLGGEFSLDCLNLKGILFLDRSGYDEAELSFDSVIASKRGDLYTRKVQVHAMSNLAYTCMAQKRLDEAIKWATKSKVLAEETGLDPFGAQFGLIYGYLLRLGEGDRERAATEFQFLVSNPRSREVLSSSLKLESNQEIRELYEQQGFRI